MDERLDAILALQRCLDRWRGGWDRKHKRRTYEVQEMRRQNAGNGYRGELRWFCGNEAAAVPELREQVQDT